MDGDFIFKFVKVMLTLVFMAALFLVGVLLADLQTLQNNTFRICVVGNSKCIDDQITAQSVGNSVTKYLLLQNYKSATEAKSNISEQLEYIAQLVNEQLDFERAKLLLVREAIDTSDYGTFTLPAGLYESLRIELGDGNGEQYSFIIFPGVCATTLEEDFRDIAMSAGWNLGLCRALSGEGVYRFGFYLLDSIGRIYKNIEI